LFAKYFPTIAVAEIKYVLKTSGEHQKRDMDKVENQKVEEFVHEHAH
jgi:molybdopterin-containing oxidoreductase family membrane subunit